MFLAEGTAQPRYEDIKDKMLCMGTLCIVKCNWNKKWETSASN